MEHDYGTDDSQASNEPAQPRRRSQWILWVVCLPLLATPMLRHLSMSRLYVTAFRTAFSIYILLLTTAALVWFTLTIRRHWITIVRRWGGRIIVLGAYGIFVPFVYMPFAYLVTGAIGNRQLDIVMTAGTFGVSIALFGVGLLIALVEIGMDAHTH